jgi:predicted RNA-binding protein YlxR (DUF448 family)
MRGHEPIRTCVGCGGRDRQRALVRFVACPDGLAADGTRRAPGRGAYLHRRPECWAAFARRRGPVRSLRLTPGRPERERLVAALAASEGER